MRKRVLFCVLAVLPAIILEAEAGEGGRGQGAPGPDLTQARVTVCTWRGNKRAAFTFCIDDGVPKPTPVMAKVFDENHVKATWYPVVQDWTNWKMWAEHVKAGHEVGSHTKTHPSLKNCSHAQKMDEIVDSKAVMEREIGKYVPGYKCLTFCVPLGSRDCDEATMEIVRQHYIATKRSALRARRAPPDLYSLGGRGARTATPLAEYNGWVDEVLKRGGWLIETYHGIEGVGGWEATPLDVFKEHVEYAASKRDEMWIDTIAEIAKYIQERDSVSVEIAEDSQEELIINLTDKMDDAVFDAPLTLKIQTRPGWKSPLAATQQGRTARVELVKEAGRLCAYIEAVPDQGPIVVRPASPAREKATSTGEVSSGGGLGRRAVQADGDGHLEPWGSDTHPTDVAKRHVEDVGAGRHEYSVVQGGTMDGTNCCSPMSVGMHREGAMEQTWESNRVVRMANVGTTDVVNPWLSNGRNNFRTPREIVNNAIEPGMTDREKAMAIWFQECRYRYHGGTEGGEDSDPVKIYNVYSAYMCGTNTSHFAQLLNMAGLKVGFSGSTVGHTTSRVFFDGGWHYMDANQDTMFLLRDNQTIADTLDITRDHDLAKRAHSAGILLIDHPRLKESFAAYFAHEEDVPGELGRYRRTTTMDMTLRPGEALVWRWGYLTPPRIRGREKPSYPNMVCNGLWEYRPDLSGDLWRGGASSVENVQAGPDGLCAGEGGDGTIVWAMKAPYVLVGGRLEVEGAGARFALSYDGEKWKDVDGTDLNPFFPPVGGAPHYDYRLRCTLSGDARLKGLAIVNDLQMTPRVLPGTTVGENAFVYTDETRGEREVRVMHEWVERSASQAPGVSPAPVSPADGGETDGTDIVFQWRDAPDADGDVIADYHFELSDGPRIRFPLSTNFYRLISRTRDKGKAQYTLSAPGLLTPGTTYYWHVRAKDEKGVWGPWSETWSFTAQGPAHSLDVALDYDAKLRRGVLTWKPNPIGRAPVAFRVYGSDEKGFSVSDEPHDVNLGECKELTSPFPANFIAETTDTEMVVLGPEVKLPAANKAYYRVVAIDADGKRSGPSDYVSAPRPVIYTAPVTTARVGREYCYDVGAVRSIGDLTYRMEGKLAKSFWEIEHPDYALAEGPAWLTIDSATGLLTGTPDATGKENVVVTVTTDREVRELDTRTLGWGREKVIGRSAERVGGDVQRFTIEVTE